MLDFTLEATEGLHSVCKPEVVTTNSYGKYFPNLLSFMQLEGDKSRYLLRPGFEVGQRKRSSLSDPLPRTSVKEQVFR